MVLTDDERNLGSRLANELASLRAQTKAKQTQMRDYVGAMYAAHPDERSHGLVPALCRTLGITRNHVYRLRDEYQLAHPVRRRKPATTSGGPEFRSAGQGSP